MTLGPDLLLDDADGDLFVSDEGEGKQVISVKQAITIALRFVRGEWFLDTEAGVPYFERVFIKKGLNLDHVGALFRQAIAETPGVQSVFQFSFAFDEGRRLFSVTFGAETVEGLIEGEEVFPV